MGRTAQLQAQNSQVFLFAGVLLVLSLFLTAYTGRNPSARQIGARIVGEVFSPLQAGVASTTNFFVGMTKEYQALTDAREENSKLKSRLSILEAENAKLREFEFENTRLSKLLSFVEGEKISGVAARLIGRNPGNWVDSVLVNAGASVGVEVGDPAVDSVGGVVGRVISASSNASTILFISDNASGVDVLLQNSRARGIVTGLGNGRCELSFVDREVDVVVGDKIITSGMDGVYPKGLSVGVVASAEKDAKGLFQKVIISPTVTFKKLEELFIITSGAVPLKQ